MKYLIILLLFNIGFSQPREEIDNNTNQDKNGSGILYINEYGIAQDYAEVIKSNKIAAEQGDITAQFYLGYAYHTGNYAPQDYEEAIKWYTLAAEQGDIDAQNNLGILYAYGQGTPQNYEEANKWYALAAE